MNSLDLNETDPKVAEAAARRDPSRDNRRPRIGLRVDLHNTVPGVVELRAAPEHRVTVHAGPPVRGACQLEPFVVTRGTVNIFPAGTTDMWEEENASTLLVLEISPWLLRRTAEDIGVDPERAGLTPRHHFRDPQIEHIGWALEAERAAGYPGGLIYSESLGAALAIHLLGRYPAPLTSSRGLSPRQLRRVTEHIDAYLDGDLSLRRLADVADVSASHLKMLFKRSTGLPVHEYVVKRRVERARSLLLRGGMPASQIAVEAGFAHQSHMARTMRRVLGITPTSLVRGAAGATLRADSGRAKPS
jgi:AraC family transcriptional regulator